jgi:hypothetical protein
MAHAHEAHEARVDPGSMMLMMAERLSRLRHALRR